LEFWRWFGRQFGFRVRRTFTAAPQLTATLTVSGSSGQTSSVSHTVTVTNAPASVTANFSASPSSGQAPLTVQFTDQIERAGHFLELEFW